MKLTKESHSIFSNFEREEYRAVNEILLPYGFPILAIPFKITETKKAPQRYN